jgi:hypothetical protein
MVGCEQVVFLPAALLYAGRLPVGAGLLTTSFYEIVSFLQGF